MAFEDVPLSRILDDLARSGHADAVSIGEVLDTFQHRSLGALLTLFGVIALLPIIGDIPGMAILTGTLILLAVSHSFFGGSGFWMPGFVRRRAISRDRFDKGIKKARPWLERVERVLKPRLTGLIAGRAGRLTVAAAAALLAVTFYPLAFVPFGVNAPAAGVLAFGLGLMAGDGLLILLGYAFSALTLYVLFVGL